MPDHMRRTSFGLFAILCLLACAVQDVRAQQSAAIRLGDWLSASANVDGGYRSTQLFETDYQTALVQWDSRIDVWLPPYRDMFAWGPYVRVAAIASSEIQPWENAWLSRPGLGVQVYPVSLRRFQARDSIAGKLFGPVRLFAEYNVQRYWGRENTWRPDSQVRVGLDYWKAAHVNDETRAWWLEIWNGAYWQSANEFSDDYRTVVLANSVRSGFRLPGRPGWSLITPYAAVESSRTKNNSYYWENRLLLGGGARVSPSLSPKVTLWLSRFVIYAEALKVGTYYGVAAPATVPRVDVRIGISASLGDWYK